MKEQKMSKGPILLPLLLLVIGLGAYTMLNFRAVSAADSMEVGRQYLNKLDYSSAAAAFTQAITLDPGSTEARVGLAQAYAGTGDYEMALETVREIVYGQDPDEAAVRQTVDILDEMGMTAAALELTGTLVRETDAEEYYTLRQTLLAKYNGRSRSLARGTDQVLVIQSGNVLARGSNTLGQLGVDPDTLANAEQLISAGFPGTAKMVFCVGRTSCVVDDTGALWAAGEDRWGQLGGGFAVTQARGGWYPVSCAGKVAAAAGTTGRLLVLLEDGSLWSAGAGVGKTLQRLAAFPVVTQLESAADRAVLLTGDGVLYESAVGTPDRWSMVSRNVRSFTLTEDGLSWIGSTGTLHREWSGVSAPQEWYREDGSIIPQDLRVTEFAAVGDLALLLAADGTVWRLPGDGTAEQVSLPAGVVRLYGLESALVLEYVDGTAAVWNSGAAAPVAVTHY